jgi:uncharacterized membrane protein YebE (DUF533 family)
MGYLKKWVKKVKKTVLPDSVEKFIDKNTPENPITGAVIGGLIGGGLAGGYAGSSATGVGIAATGAIAGGAIGYAQSQTVSRNTPVAPVTPTATLTTGSEGVRSGMLMRAKNKKGAAYLAATAGQRSQNAVLGGMKQTLG